VDSRVPAALAAIVMKCLAKNPAERYARGNDLADALVGWLTQSSPVEGFRAAWLGRRLGITPTT
jgi:serine/threonine-protein kinase